MRRFFSVLCCTFCVATMTYAQTPLDRQLRDAAARGPVVWVSYRVPAAPRGGDTWCEHQTHVYLEGPTEVVVLTRFEHGDVTKVRTTSPACEIDSGGVPLVPLTGVTSDDSVKWLTSLVKTTPVQDQVARGALSALAMHATAAVVPPLVEFAKNDNRKKIRGEALFWLAQRAGREAVATITGAVDNDPDTEVKKKAVFALSQLPKDEGVSKLLDVARNNRNPAVRKQAIFWLGQSNDPRALAFFEEVLLKK